MAFVSLCANRVNLVPKLSSVPLTADRQYLVPPGQSTWRGNSRTAQCHCSWRSGATLSERALQASVWNAGQVGYWAAERHGVRCRTDWRPIPESNASSSASQKISRIFDNPCSSPFSQHPTTLPCSDPVSPVPAPRPASFAIYFVFDVILCCPEVPSPKLRIQFRATCPAHLIVPEFGHSNNIC